jgi:hypothetical protein
MEFNTRCQSSCVTRFSHRLSRWAYLLFSRPAFFLRQGYLLLVFPVYIVLNSATNIQNQTLLGTHATFISRRKIYNSEETNARKRIEGQLRHYFDLAQGFSRQRQIKQTAEYNS